MLTRVPEIEQDVVDFRDATVIYSMHNSVERGMCAKIGR